MARVARPSSLTAWSLTTRWRELPANVSRACRPTGKQASQSSECGSRRIVRSRASSASARSAEVPGDATTACREVDGSALIAERLDVFSFRHHPPPPWLSQHLEAPTRLAPSELVTAARPWPPCYGEGMKVGVVADTHLPRFGVELPASLRDGLRNERVHLIVHLGDFTGTDTPKLFEVLAPLEAVAGNNDPPELVARFGRRKIVPVDGVRLGLVHGDGPRGTTIDRSVSAFAQETVDVICFGHSHQPLCERRGGLWLVNPGSPTDRRQQPRCSYAILEIVHGRVIPRLVFFDRPARPSSAQSARSSLSKSSASSTTSSARRSTP